MTIEITERNDRGFHQYGAPVLTSYGEKVEVFESSIAKGPHCWLRVYDDGDAKVSQHVGKSMSAHLSLDEAIAIRDRLSAFIDEVPTRWNPDWRSQQ